VSRRSASVANWPYASCVYNGCFPRESGLSVLSLSFVKIDPEPSLELMQLIVRQTFIAPLPRAVAFA
jgi:hypothetical protein